MNGRRIYSAQRALVDRLLEFLDTHFKTIRTCMWRFSIPPGMTPKIERDARKMQYLLDGRRHTHGGKEGRFFLENGDLLFRPKYAKRTGSIV